MRQCPHCASDDPIVGEADCDPVVLAVHCPKCGAITTQVLELAWRARVVTCTECLTSMPLDTAVLNALREQAVDALTAIDRLA